MKIEDFYPVNKWSTVEPGRYNVDKTTDRHYPYVSDNELKLRSAAFAVITPIVHLAAAVAFVGVRIIRLISFWHFWKPQAKNHNFKIQLKEAGTDLLKIVSHPFSILALEMLSFYGLFRPQDWRKLYCSIEKFQYDRHLIMSFLDMAPETPKAPRPPPKPEPEPKPPIDDEMPENPPNTTEDNPPVNPPTDPKPNPPNVNPNIPQELPVADLPEIKKVISDKIESFPITFPQKAMKDSITSAIVQHIVEFAPRVNLSEVISNASVEAKAQFTAKKIKLNPELTETYIQDKLVERISKELKNHNLELLKNLLKTEGIDAIAANIAKEIQNEYVQNFEELNQLIIGFVPQKDNSPVDIVEESNEDDNKGPAKDPLTACVENTRKLNEILDLFNDNEMIKKLGIDVIDETKKALLKSNHSMKILYANLAAMPWFDPVKSGVAQAIVAIGECLNQTKTDGSLSIDDFLDCCQVVLQTLKTGEEVKSLDNPKDLFLFVYLVTLRGIYSDSVARVQKTLEKRVEYNKDHENQMKDLTSKINKLLDMDIEFKVVMQVDDDDSIKLIASIPKITATTDQIREWLISKANLDKVAFKAWLQRKADKGYHRLLGIKANLDILEDMFKAGV